MLPQSVVLSPALAVEVGAHAAGAYPEECCGLLLGVVSEAALRITAIIPAENTAPSDTRRHRYVIDPRVMLAADHSARAQGVDIIGAYHSHPDHAAIPSVYDIEHSWEGFVYVIVPVNGGVCGTMRAWQIEGGEKREIALAGDDGGRARLSEQGSREGRKGG